MKSNSIEIQATNSMQSARIDILADKLRKVDGLMVFKVRKDRLRIILKSETIRDLTVLNIALDIR